MMSQNSPVRLSELAPDRTVAALPQMEIENVVQQALSDCFTAAQIVVCHKGNVLWHRAYGLAEPTTLFDLASVTKLFTVTAFLSLAGEGRVMLTLPVADLIPEFATSNIDQNGRRPVGEVHDPHSWGVLAPEEAHAGKMVNPRDVTFRHLLTHTSGLAPWPNLFEQIGPIPPPEGIADPAERMRRHQKGVELISGYPFAGPPDSGIRYSDQGLILLGEAVARLHALAKSNSDDVRLDTAIKERVLSPLGLKTTMFNPALAGVSLKDIAPTEFDARWRRRRVHGEVHDENAAALGGVAGHAGLFSTAYEVARFGQAWLDCTKGPSPLPVPSDLAQEAVRIQEAEEDIRRGLGWMIKSTGEYSSAGKEMSLKTFGHTGFTGTSLFIDPKQDLIVASLNNRVYHGRDTKPISEFRPALHDAIVKAVNTVTEPGS